MCGRPSLQFHDFRVRQGAATEGRPYMTLLAVNTIRRVSLPLSYSSPDLCDSTPRQPEMDHAESQWKKHKRINEE